MYNGAHVDIPLGLGGFDGNSNFYQIPATRLTVARNIVFRNDAIVKSPGITAIDSTGVGASVTLYGGHDWKPTTALQYQVTAWSDGNVYRSDTASTNLDATTLLTGATFTEPVSFVTGGHLSLGADRTLYMYSKNERPQGLAGTATSFSNLTADSPDWSTNYPGGAIYHDARIYAFNLDNAPHNYYVSALLDHGDYSLANGSKVFSIFPGEGQYISAMASFGGTILYAFKYPVGIYRIDTQNISGWTLPAERVRDDIGCAGSNAVIKVGADVYFVSPNGRLYSLASLNPDADVRDADITSLFNLESFIKENFDKNRAKWVTLAYDEVNKELHYSFTSKSSTNTVNDTSIIFNLETQGDPKISFDDRGEFFNKVWRKSEDAELDTLYTGGYGGKVYELNTENRNVDGAAFTGEFQIPETDLRWVDPKLQGMRKRFDMIELTIIPSGNYDTTVTFTVDGQNNLSRTINLADFEDVYDTADYGTGTFAGGRVAKKRIPVNAWGETIAINFSNNGVNEEFKMVNLRLYYKAAGQVYESA